MDQGMIETSMERRKFSAVPDTALNKLTGKIGLILSGGGARGALEVGAMKVILSKVKPDILIGTSVGAMNAAFIAAGGSIEELEDIWHHISTRLLFPRNMSFFYRFSHVDALSKNFNLKQLLQRIIKKQNIEECNIPLFVNATRLSDGESIFFNRGNLVHALMASSAIPPFYPPYIIDNINYLDGGVSASNGIRKSIDLGCDTIIVIDSTNTKRLFTFSGIFDVTRHALHLMFKKSLLNEIELCRDKRIILISSPDIDVGTNDFSRTEELIRTGEQVAREVMDDLEL